MVWGEGGGGVVDERVWGGDVNGKYGISEGSRFDYVQKASFTFFYRDWSFHPGFSSAMGFIS